MRSDVESGGGRTRVGRGALYGRSATVVSRLVGGETLIVPVRGKVGDLASIYSFNQTGSLIWMSLETPKSLGELVDAVEKQYDVERQRAEQDVTQFLSEMFSAGLVEVLEGVGGSRAETPVGREGVGAVGAG